MAGKRKLRRLRTRKFVSMSECDECHKQHLLEECPGCPKFKGDEERDISFIADWTDEEIDMVYNCLPESQDLYL